MVDDKTTLFFVLEDLRVQKNSKEYYSIEIDNDHISINNILNDSPVWNIGLGLNLAEYISAIILSRIHPGSRIYRLPLSNGIGQYISLNIQEKVDINPCCLTSNDKKWGSPDFLLFNHNTGFFCFYECKLGRDKINSNQQRWLNDYDYPTKIIKLLDLIEVEQIKSECGKEIFKKIESLEVFKL